MWCFIIISFSEYDFGDLSELIELLSYDTGIDCIYSNLIYFFTSPNGYAVNTKFKEVLDLPAGSVFWSRRLL